MKKVGIFIIFMALFVFLFWGLGFTDGKGNKKLEVEEIILGNFVGMNIRDLENYADRANFEIETSYEYSYEYDKDVVISQDKIEGTMIKTEDVVKVIVSLGSVPVSVYHEYKVNELGNVPIMMYHGIVDVRNDDTKHIGGNVDKDGYNRTAEAFRNDLEFYYKSGYRMIRLDDYVDGVVNVELGKSPIILTFDDGNVNNFRVLGEENGELIIDPNCAVGILEEFKNKYPDYGVTATFFVNAGLFEQSEYNEKILNWLVSHGYDVGNHTMTHVDFTKVGIDASMREVGGVYNILEKVIPNKYVNIVALPFGSPYKRSHGNYSAILNGIYNEREYNTKAALRVGWEAELSSFDVNFDRTFLKRIRAYDNNGKDFDIEMNFKMLESKRYISDGDVNTVVVFEKDKDRVVQGDRRVIWY